MSAPVDLDEASELAVWVGQLFTHLNDEQVREFKRLFVESGIDRETIERAVRRYARDYQYATIPGIGDALVAQRRRDLATAESAAKRLDFERRIEQLIDERIAGYSPAELAELVDELFGPTSPTFQNLPARVSARMRAHAQAHPVGSGIIRARVRGMLIAEVNADEQRKLDEQRGQLQLPGPDAPGGPAAV